MNKISFIFNRKILKYNVDRFGLNNNILYVTGLSGSGKTTLAKDFSCEYNAILFELDTLGGFYSEYKDCNSMIRELTKDFLNFNKELDLIIRKNKFVKLKIKNFNEYSKWINKYIKYLEEYTYNTNGLFVFEGTQLFKCLDPKYFISKPLVIVRTSALISMFRRIRRQKYIDKIKGKKHFYKKHFWKLLNDSKRLHYRDVKLMNKFLNALKK